MANIVLFITKLLKEEFNEDDFDIGFITSWKLIRDLLNNSFYLIYFSAFWIDKLNISIILRLKVRQNLPSYFSHVLHILIKFSCQHYSYLIYIYSGFCIIWSKQHVIFELESSLAGKFKLLSLVLSLFKNIHYSNSLLYC